VDDEISIRLEASSLRPLAGWELTIADPTGRTFVEYGGEGAPEPLIQWDGRDDSGELVQSAQEYLATFAVWDVDGNRSEEQHPISVDILVIRDGDRLRINIPSITFAPFTADLFAVELAELEQNLETLRRLAAILERFPDYEILIEGHAAHVYTAEGPAKEREQREVLLPLSRSRAEEVRQALIILGIERDRMRSEGIGGARPVVPHEDQANRWKNRRVEFILERGSS
jgi:outer membrane protein OmpA-like peptidoglycan-associated protein